MSGNKKTRWRYRLLPVVLGVFLLAGMFALLVPVPALAAGGSLTIVGPGLNNQDPDGDGTPGVTITQNQLRSTEALPPALQLLTGWTHLPQCDEWYSTINTWPTKKFYRGKGVKLNDLLQLAEGLNGQATLIKFIASDGFAATFTVQELVYKSRYRFPNFMYDENGNWSQAGHIIGNTSGAVLVEPVIAWKSGSSPYPEEPFDDENLSTAEANHLLYGQRAVTQQTNARFAKYTVTIQVLTDTVQKWNNPTASVPPGEVPVGTEVELNSQYNDEDKVHYTLDSSDPTIESSMYNWIASRWWSSRQDVLYEINHPVEITQNTVIKAFVTGPGRDDSDIVTFQYTVPTVPVTGVSIAGGNQELEVGQTAQLTAVVAPANATNKNVTWSSSDASIATVSETGLVTAVGEGTATITVTTEDGGYTASITVTQIINPGAGQKPGGKVILTITGDGVYGTKEFTLSQLEEMPQYQEVYSCINTWPSKKWYVGRGVKLNDLLDAAGGIKPGATLIRSNAGDGYYMMLTVKELLRDRRYRFPNFKTGGDADGHIPGDPSGAVEVKTIIGLVSAEGTDDPSYINNTNTPLLMLGQRAVTEQNGPLFVKYVNKIEVLTSPIPKWDAPRAGPGSGTVPAGALVRLSNNNMDIDKIHYTTDGSTPDLNSPIYNWIARRWWAARGEGTVAEINHPIAITKDTIIKAVTIGPGKEDSEVVTFTYKVTGAQTSQGDRIAPGESATVSLGDEATIKIPANALTGAQAVVVKIEKVSAPLAPPAGYRLVGSVYEFSVDGKPSYSFAKKVSIRLSFDPDTLGEGETPSIHRYDQEQGRWINLGGEVAGNTVSVEVEHLTKYAVMVAMKAPAPAFPDLAGHWAENSIKEMVALGAISGYQDGTFRPDNKITRAEFATILVKAFKLATQSGKVFADTAGHWAQDTIATATYHGIVSGYDANTFGPDDPITREQMAAMMVRTVKLSPVTAEMTFTDSGSISGWARKAVVTAVKNGIINGYPDHTVRPQGHATRAEAVTVIVKVMHKR